MISETMTVHKALCELKTLDARIRKTIEGSVYVFANKHSNTKVSGLSIGDYSTEIKSAYQSATDLIARRDAIKRAVVLSNAVTKVTVGGNEYTVAEAIEMKNHGIPIQRSLLDKLKDDSRRARREADESNGVMLEMRADEYIRSLYANADMKNLSDEVKKMRADFLAAQVMEIVDPIKVANEIERLETLIDTFTVEIDAALSVSNALTEITVEY